MLGPTRRQMRRLPPKMRSQPFNVLVGSWRGTGAPEGTKEERAAGAWGETIEWDWKFKDKDAWLEVAFEKGKYFTKGELRYTPNMAEKNDDKSAAPRFTLNALETGQVHGDLCRHGERESRYVGTSGRPGGRAAAARLQPAAPQPPPLSLRIPAGGVTTVAFTRKFQVGATKEGVPFADVPKGPECIVSGGLGTMKVSHARAKNTGCAVPVAATSSRRTLKNTSRKSRRKRRNRRRSIRGYRVTGSGGPAIVSPNPRPVLSRARHLIDPPHQG